MRISTVIILLIAVIIGVGSPAEIEAAAIGTTALSPPVTDSSRLVSDLAFREAFDAYLYQHLKKEESDIVLSRFKIANNKPIPDGAVDLQLFQKSKGALKGHVRLVAIVKVDGVAHHEVKLTGWVDVFSPVVCAARNLKKGDILKEDDVILERKNTSRMPAAVLSNVDAVRGLTAKHSIREGTSLKAWMVERSPILVKGDLVTILAELGSIRITAPGKIMEKGYPGELIRVQNAMSRKEIYARVINNSTVTVDF